MHADIRLLPLPCGWSIRPPPEVGAIAQLGERLNGIQEVSGSIPLGSTNLFNELGVV